MTIGLHTNNMIYRDSLGLDYLCHTVYRLRSTLITYFSPALEIKII
jgi:hypothetical protein